MHPASMSLHGQERLHLPMQSFFMSSLYHPISVEYSGGGGGGGGGSSATGEPMDRAAVASRNHREAEKRRRERIKSHLDQLRTVLACDPKIDKASLLAKAVERVRDLKQRTAGITAIQHFPTENDEIIVLPSSSCHQGPTVFEASLCCDDRSNLLPEIIETLRGLRMRALRAEIATLGGRVRSVLVVARERGDNEDEREEEELDIGNGESLRDALKALVDRPIANMGADRPKRRRMVDMSLT